MNALTQKTNGTCAPVENDAELYVRPEVDIHETPEAYVLHAEMPGVNKERLSITVEEDRLTVTGRKAPATAEAAVLLKETAVASYRRTFQLSPEIDRDHITARIEQGLVTLTLAKTRKPAPRRIEVV